LVDLNKLEKDTTSNVCGYRWAKATTAKGCEVAPNVE